MDKHNIKIKRKIFSGKIRKSIYKDIAKWNINIVENTTGEVLGISDICETAKDYYWVNDIFYKWMLDIWKIEYLISLWFTHKDFFVLLKIVCHMDYDNMVNLDSLCVDRFEKSRIKIKLQKAWIIKNIWKDVYMNPIYFRKQKWYNRELKDLFWL